MRDLILLRRREEIEGFLRALWRTGEFRGSHDDPCGYVRHWAARFAATPRIFFTMTHPEVERSHFTPWFNALHFRDYANPAVHDLFCLHEIVHAVTMTYDADLPFAAWLEKMAENEMRTSLESEVMVYFELPGLRAKSFPGAIWADRFLGGPTPERAALFARRLEAMLRPTDAVERAMSFYPRQNVEWAEVWRRRYREVERRMASFLAEVDRDPGAALERHAAWLLEETGMSRERPYPFPDEAEAFAAIYHRNKRGLPTAGATALVSRAAPPRATPAPTVSPGPL